MMKKWHLPVSLAGISLMLAIGLAAGAQNQGGHYDFYSQKMTEPYETLLGKPAPQIKLNTLGGEPFDLASFKDKKIVVMDFWASWCRPCRIAMPAVAELAETYKDKDVVFYAINQGEPAEQAKSFVESTGIKLPVALDEKTEASEAYFVDSIPRLVVVGKDGTVQSVHAGLEGQSIEEAQANLKKRLTAELDKLLAGKSLVPPKPAAPK